ncbi:MAG: branched-chain amino acid ABC transporter permease [Promethearchaeota archaeon]
MEKSSKKSPLIVRIVEIVIPLFVIIVGVWILDFLDYPIIEVIIFGTIEASVYALLAFGFSLVYGVGGILNLSHGAFYLMAGYILFWTFNITGIIGGSIISLVLITLIGGVAYLLLIRPLQENQVAVLIMTFSLGFFFENFIKVFGDTIPHAVPSIFGTLSFDILGVSFPAQFFLILIGALIVVVITGLVINKTKLGKSIRAVSQDREAAMLMGINADRVLMYTVMISAFLAGMAAILYVPASSVATFMGWDVLSTSFAIVIFGGLGSLKGSIVGAFILGYTRNIVNYFINPAFSAIVPIVVIVLVLLIRPRGLFGKKEIY